MKSCISEIPKFRDVEFVTEEAIAIKFSARKDEEKKLVAKNILLIEQNRDPQILKDSLNWKVFPFKKTYRLKALLQLDQFEFVINVFRALLGRNPSPDEMWTQIEVIRKNKLRKLNYIINLRGIEESRVYNTSFNDADRGIKLFGRFLKVKNLSSIRDIEIYLKGSEPIFNDTDDLEERFESLKINYSSISSYLNVVAETLEVQLDHLHESAKIHSEKETIPSRIDGEKNEILALIKREKEDIISLIDGVKVELFSQIDEGMKYARNVVEGSYVKRFGYKESDIEEVYFVDSPNYYNIGKKNGKKVNIDTQEKFREDYDYYLFENAFYDSKKVKRKQSHYLPLLTRARESKRKFLDLGCGRGEFLKLLKEYRVEGVGIELNHIECETLRRSGLKVYQKCIFEFIAENESLWSGVSLLHVIEHLEKDRVIGLFDDLSNLIEPDGTLIIETINPHCPKSFASFYMDHTHIKPYTPEVIAFNMQRVGFTDIKILYSNLIDHRLWSPERKVNYHDFGVLGRK